MDIFNVQIFGSDKDAFLALCKESKKKWILKNTIQRNETEIDAFINNPKVSKDCKCVNCGKNGNKSSGISKEVNESVELTDVAGTNAKDSTFRQRKSKAKKD
jgi:hypothetical protein